jgi:hypothetical protein
VEFGNDKHIVLWMYVLQMLTPEKVLCRQETEKKKKYLQACLEQRRNFTPFVSSTDELMGREATALVKRLASMTASHWKTTYSKVCG